MLHTATHSPQPTSRPSGPMDRLSADPEALFAYGSLLFPEVLRALLGRVPERTPAVAAGWRVAALTGRRYPGLVPGDAHAAGMLITGLRPGEWRVVDAFEDDMYELRKLPLSKDRHGWAYVCRDGRRVLPHDWDLGRFVTDHLASYVEACAAWRRRYDDPPA
jgi:gamma-glutamylcyclotransferase (GGCT)/AIG2-like uncharacterized protein YtfP